jgi:hypothetical protein
VSRNLITRRAGVLAAAIAAGVLGMAAPAVADVTIDPPSAPQGSGQNVHFKVTNTGSSPITRVKLVLPADTPIAEVFPLSVDNWAPQITPLKLSTPLTSIHAGTPVTETASAVTWIAVNGKAIAPGGSADLAVALGPLPLTSTMTFQLEPTYASGAGPALPAVRLALTAAEPGAATGHTTHGGGTATEPAAGSEDAAFAAVVAQAEQGPGFWSIAGWIVAALALAGAALAVLRGRHREAESGDEEPDDDEPGDDEASGEDKEPVTAGGRASSWRYSG